MADPFKDAPLRSHLVQFYRDADDLIDRVADFVEPALETRQAVILVMTPDHRQRITDVLAGRKFPLQALQTSEQLIFLDADHTLQSFLIERKPEWSRFNANVGRLMETQTKKYEKVRAFGEMVNLLWSRGYLNAALDLERFWNRLEMMHPFCLFCGYSLELFDMRTQQQAIASICHAHSYAAFPSEVQSSR